ncbi:ferredoxin--NADP(+) reductase, partial [Neisseria iguanae]
MSQSNQRIPALLLEGGLEKYISFTFNKADTRFMVCGNP